MLRADGGWRRLEPWHVETPACPSIIVLSVAPGSMLFTLNYMAHVPEGNDWRNFSFTISLFAAKEPTTTTSADAAGGGRRDPAATAAQNAEVCLRTVTRTATDLLKSKGEVLVDGLPQNCSARYTVSRTSLPPGYADSGTAVVDGGGGGGGGGAGLPAPTGVEEHEGQGGAPAPPVLERSELTEEEMDILGIPDYSSDSDSDGDGDDNDGSAAGNSLPVPVPVPVPAAAAAAAFVEYPPSTVAEGTFTTAGVQGDPRARAGSDAPRFTGISIPIAEIAHPEREPTVGVSVDVLPIHSPPELHLTQIDAAAAVADPGAGGADRGGGRSGSEPGDGTAYSVGDAGDAGAAGGGKRVAAGDDGTDVCADARDSQSYLTEVEPGIWYGWDADLKDVIDNALENTYPLTQDNIATSLRYCGQCV